MDDLTWGFWSLFIPEVCMWFGVSMGFVLMSIASGKKYEILADDVRQHCFHI